MVSVAIKFSTVAPLQLCNSTLLTVNNVNQVQSLVSLEPYIMTMTMAHAESSLGRSKASGGMGFFMKH